MKVNGVQVRYTIGPQQHSEYGQKKKKETPYFYFLNILVPHKMILQVWDDVKVNKG